MAPSPNFPDLPDDERAMFAKQLAHIATLSVPMVEMAAAERPLGGEDAAFGRSDFSGGLRHLAAEMERFFGSGPTPPEVTAFIDAVHRAG